MLTPSEHRQMVEQMKAFIKMVESQAPEKCCFNCDSFKDGFCNHWQADVPEGEKEKGCNEWVELIPF